MRFFSIIVASVVNVYLKDSSSQAFVYVAIVFYSFMLLSLVAEALIYKKHRPIVRITIGIILLLIAIMMFTQKVSPSADVELLDNPFELGGFVLVMSIFIIFLMSVFTNFILIRAYRREGEVSGTIGTPQSAVPHLKGYLPVGFFSKKAFYYLFHYSHCHNHF